jgi:hypothetical protein
MRHADVVVEQGHKTRFGLSDETDHGIYSGTEERDVTALGREEKDPIVAIVGATGAVGP